MTHAAPHSKLCLMLAVCRKSSDDRFVKHWHEKGAAKASTAKSSKNDEGYVGGRSHGRVSPN